MSRIKGRYVAQVVIEFDAPRRSNTFPLEKIRHHLCDGDMKRAITEVLSFVTIDDSIVTVDQLFADVYEVDDDGTD